MTGSFQEEHEQRLERAERGDVDAQREVGQALVRGSVVSRDLDAGRQWLERAIQSDDVPSMLWLARHDLLAGRHARGPRSAWSLFQRAAELGDAGARRELASGIRFGLGLDDDARDAYFERTGLPQDPALAAQLEADAGPRPEDDSGGTSDER